MQQILLQILNIWYNDNPYYKFKPWPPDGIAKAAYFI